MSRGFRPDDRSYRWLMRPVREARKRANRIILELGDYGGASEKLVAKARRVLDAYAKIEE
jgi:hypothetical protein